MQQNRTRRSATDSWLSEASYLPVLTDPPAQTAERLILLLHYGIDWSDRNWVVGYIGDYWDNLLPTRVRAATYSSASLHHWWTTVAARLGSTPRNDGQRRELATLLTADPLPVLQVIRDQSIALTLRTRIVAEAVRASRPELASSDTSHSRVSQRKGSSPRTDIEA